MDKVITNQDVIIETTQFRLVVGSDCVAKSLVCKANGQECLAPNAKLPLFSSTQNRPFNNEVKLAYPCKRTTYPANSLRREGDKLFVGFEIAPYDAVIRVEEKPLYAAFTVEELIEHPKGYGSLAVDKPPLVEFCLLQLPVADRENFGEWLNVIWDEDTAVNVLATAPETLIDAEQRDGYHIMNARVRKDIRVMGPGVALIAGAKDKLMDAIDAVEVDFDLPRGVKNRRDPLNNASIYYTFDLSPETVDQHIAYAKAGGFRLMQIYYTCMFKETDHWSLCGNYDYNEHYPNGKADLLAVLEKVKAAGIVPGLHFLQPHIGLKSRYVTPVADHRLRLRSHFTLAKPLGMDDTTIYVEQIPIDVPVREEVRILRFGGELIRYESASTEYPYCFTGCERGACQTNVTEHPLGEIGGVLDVSEYGGYSTYLDQNTSLAEEISEKLADVLNCGFRFIYFDGSEGTNVPYEYYIPRMQYGVYKKVKEEPVLAEGAAKAHFSWHMLTGGNAFDVFRPHVFKQKIGEYPVAEIKRMKNDFTRVNFGWWCFWGVETQADQYEYSSSRAIAWDCPATVQGDIRLFGQNPRLYDVLEVLRRWEEVRATNWLTDEQKEMLKDLEQEHILLINEQKEFELLPYDQIKDVAGGAEDITAFSFTRNGESYVVYWHHSGSATLNLPVDKNDIAVVEELWEQPMEITANGKGGTAIPAEKRRYVKSKLPVEELIRAFQQAELTDVKKA